MRMLMTWLGKSTAFLLHIFQHGGAALPGLLIEKIYPNYLTVMLDQLPRGVIVVTGTNGKTTTTKTIVDLLRATGLRVLTNPTGSNFVRGIMAACAAQATLTGRLPYDIAVFEQDEAHAVLFAKSYQPVGVVALNVMRDQMDRFGEIDATAKLIGKLVASAHDWVVLNANDRRVADLATLSKGKGVTWFGHTKTLQKLFIDDDQLYSDKPVFYEAATPRVVLTGVRNGSISLKIDGKPHTVSTALDGTHNAMNAAAAIATYLAAVPEAELDPALERLRAAKPAFGRGEAVRLHSGAELRLQLVKNPAGFRHALHAIDDKQYGTIGIVINDDFADGRDVSWLWDVDFTAIKGRAQHVICGGTRAADMAVRLKYDGVETMAALAPLDVFLQKVVDTNSPSSIVFCTYTAMLALRKQLKRHDKQLKAEGL